MTQNPSALPAIQQLSEIPPGLLAIQHPPKQLYVQGFPEALGLLARLPESGLAIVGTREPQNRSLAVVSETVAELAGTSLIILSGLARGIDAAAHRAALKAGLPTIAVLAGGPDIIYPSENDKLAHDIVASGGLLISEFPRGQRPIRGFFIRRNRLIAGWSSAVWVVEAGYRSGALNTARWARDNHRISFATPCFPGDPALKGNQDLLDRHHAEPFWSAQSLGQVWLELSTLPAFFPTRRTKDAESARPLRELALQVERCSRGEGGATMDGLLTWAVERGWTPQNFFLAVHDAAESGLIQEHNGVLIGGPASGPNH